MADQGRVDRLKWATLVKTIIDREYGGNQSAFARAVVVTPRTISRWLDQTNDVSESSVRDVARALGRDPMQMLILVGYYTDAEARRWRMPTELGMLILSRLANSGMSTHDELAREAKVSVDEVAELIYGNPPKVSDEVRARVGAVLDLPVQVPQPANEFGDLAREIAALLAPDSALNDDERRNLVAVLEAVLRPYRMTEHSKFRTA